MDTSGPPDTPEAPSNGALDKRSSLEIAWDWLADLARRITHFAMNEFRQRPIEWGLFAIFVGSPAFAYGAFVLWPWSASSHAPWIITLACAVFSGRVATRFLRDDPQLFAIMGLFAFSMTLLLMFWSNKGASKFEIIGAYASFLTVYIGILLMLYRHTYPHTVDGTTPTARKEIVKWQAFALLWLGALALPELRPESGLVALNPRQFDLVVDNGLGVIGFFVVGRGVWHSFEKRNGLFLSVILAFYSVVGVVYAAHYVPEGHKVPTMSWLYAYLFSVAKLAYTVAFSVIIAHRGMPDADRKAGPWHWFLMFIGVASGGRKEGQSVEQKLTPQLVPSQLVIEVTRLRNGRPYSPMVWNVRIHSSGNDFPHSEPAASEQRGVLSSN